MILVCLYGVYVYMFCNVNNKFDIGIVVVVCVVGNFNVMVSYMDVVGVCL